ncbi:FecR family protein [Bacteroides sp.]
MDTIESNIARILSGEASSEDILALNDWLNEDSRHRLELQLLQGYWDARVDLTGEPDSVSVEYMLDKIRKQDTLKRNKRWVWTFASSAAAILILVVGFFFLSERAMPEVPQYYTYLGGESKSKITLEDGTKVVLNKHSKLSYSSQFGVDRRVVRLDGEAFFEVTHDKSHPFEVEMGGAKIIVLGTTFDVKASLESDVIVATLVQGSIRFESPKQKVMISPNQQLKFNKKGSGITIEEVDAQYETSWKDNLIQYKSIRLNDLVKELELRYQTRIKLPKETRIATRQVSGSFTEEQKIEEVLDIITRSLRLQWHRQEGGYIIESR